MQLRWHGLQFLVLLITLTAFEGGGTAEPLGPCLSTPSTNVLSRLSGTNLTNGPNITPECRAVLVGMSGLPVLVTDENALMLGFKDRTEAISAQSGVPLEIYLVSLADLRRFDPVGNKVTCDLPSGSRINTITLGSGSSGDVTINATNSVSISGEFPSVPLETIFGVGTIHPSGIFTGTAVGDVPCSDHCGNAGRISITTGSLTLDTGAQIDASTSIGLRGGDITIQATDRISMSGTLRDGSPVGIFSRSIGTTPNSGAGGNISLTAGQSVSLNNGSSISASSTGPGNTGNIHISSGNHFTMTNSSVTTEAHHARGGTIKIATTPSGTVQLTNSTISASVLDGTGGGGSVNINPQFVILLNSQILAQAVHGPGGNISITTNLLLPDANSVISAKSQSNVNGTVTIQSPNAPISGHIQPLGATPLPATSLLNQRCASLAGGEFSSFTVAGRDSLPTEPGGWLSSPLAAMSAGMGLATMGEGERPMAAEETPLLSLRQIAPPGFLTQAFAVDWSASCTS